MSNQSARNRRVQSSRADLRAEQSAQELAQEDYATTRPVYREYDMNEFMRNEQNGWS